MLWSLVTAGNGGSGGGLYNDNGSPSIGYCKFNSNVSVIGGAMFNSTSSPVITHCSFVANQQTLTSFGGAAIYDEGNSNPVISYTSFTNNQAASNGAGVYHNDGLLTLLSCTFTGNTAASAAALACAGSLVMDSCIFTNNVGASEAGVLSNNTISLVATNCIFSGNYAGNNGGAFIQNYGLAASFTNCQFIGNYAHNGSNAGAGGAYRLSSGTVTFTNCLFDGNQARGTAHDGGGAICMLGGTINLVNTTLVNNTSAGRGGAISVYNAAGLLIKNSIFSRNTAVTSDQSIYRSGGTITASNSLLQEGVCPPGGTCGTGMVYAASPLFVDAAAGNYHLTRCSPALNAGSNADNGTSIDIDGNTRQFGTIDMGAFELQATANSIPHAYVNATVSTSGDGTSWATAFKTVQEAVSSAATCAIAQIWVAKGTYYPDEMGFLDNDRYAALALPGNVAVYGGFAGNEAAGYNLALRNFTTNPTILSGEVGAAGVADNSYNVLLAVLPGGTPILDGFTITGGNANSGITPPAATTSRGGGMFVSAGSPAVSNCLFTNNTAVGGGAFYNYTASPSIANCQFNNNTVTSNGAGIFCSGGSLSITNASFTSNTANNLGGAISNNGALSIMACNFSSNTSVSSGAAIATSGSLLLSNSNFTNNSSNLQAGALYLTSGSSNISGCIFSGNKSYGGAGAVDFAGTAQATVTNCQFLNNVVNNGSNLGTGGAVQLESGTPIATIINCLFSGNQAQGTNDDGGGAVMVYNGTANLINCTLTQNTSASHGGAISLFNNTSILNTKNCLIWNNNSAIGPNVYTTATTIANLQYTLLPEAGCPTGATCGAGMLYMQDPLFIDEAAGNYRLQTCSPAVNAGNDADNATTTDLDAATRKYGIIDIGTYELQQAATPLLIAPANKSVLKPILSVYQTITFTDNCELVATLQSKGAQPTVGNVTGKVWIEPTAPIQNGYPYCRRHYEIMPATNGSTATGTVTLYFTQADFDDYNAVPGNTHLLPIDKNDATNRLAFTLYYYNGTSSNGSGLPITYTPPGNFYLVPDVTLVYNETRLWWEASFPVVGFGGYFVGSLGNLILPVKNLVHFDVVQQGNNGLINWKVASAAEVHYFVVEKSYNGTQFGALQKVGSRSGMNVYQSIDQNLQAGTQFYRLQIVDKAGKITYSSIRFLHIGTVQNMTAYPNPTQGNCTVQIMAAQAGSLHIRLINALGQVLMQQTTKVAMGKNIVPINMGHFASGTYYLHCSGGNGEAPTVLQVVRK